MSEPPNEDRFPRPWEGNGRLRGLSLPMSSRILAATVSGWVLHDLAVVGYSAEPYLVLDLLPGSVVAIAIGLLAGLLWTWAPRLVSAAVGVVTLASILLPLSQRDVRVSLILFLLALQLLFLGAGVTAWSVRRLSLHPARTGIAAGILGSFALNTFRQGPSTVSVIVMLAGCIGVLAGRLPTDVMRRNATVGVLALPLVVGVAGGWDKVQLRRPDRSLREPSHLSNGPNLLLITLDTVRAHRLATYGHHRVTTPGLDAFVREHAVIYTQSRSSSPWTLPSHASMLTGLYPGEHGAHHPRADDRPTVELGRWPSKALRQDVPTLAERLVGLGYRTAALVSNDVYLAHEYGLDRGFEHYDDRRATRFDRHFQTLAQLAGWHPEIGQLVYRDANRMTDLALQWLDGHSGDAPFFLFVNYMDAHWPYLAPAPFDRAFEPHRPIDPLAPVAADFPLLYDRNLLYLDHHLTRLLRHMEASGILDRTVVIIVSDHGEAFGEHGFWGHDKTLYEEVIRVPLFVKRLKSVGGGTTIDEPVDSTDVYHIAQEELGLSQDGRPRRPGGPVAEWYRFAGEARSNRVPDPDVDRDLVAWMDGSLKTIVSSTGRVEVYDLDRDPGEQRDLSGEEDRQRRAQRLAEAWWATHPPAGKAPDEPIDPEVLERLRALGYLD